MSVPFLLLERIKNREANSNRYSHMIEIINSQRFERVHRGNVVIRDLLQIVGGICDLRLFNSTLEKLVDASTREGRDSKSGDMRGPGSFGNDVSRKKHCSLFCSVFVKRLDFFFR